MKCKTPLSFRMKEKDRVGVIDHVLKSPYCMGTERHISGRQKCI